LTPKLGEAWVTREVHTRKLDGKRPFGRYRRKWLDGSSISGMGRHELDCSGPG
jgi:hypothetical protein